jgi:lipopolysaccharide transport system ATP-binding protein
MADTHFSHGTEMLSSMSSECLVQCAGVGKAFQIYAQYNDRLWQVLFGRFKKFYKEYWVLRDIDLELRRGECLGIVGRNGAGKTTLLQMICGIIKPTCGNVQTRGQIAPVLALGAGFDGDLTGRENALIGGAVLGLKRARILGRLDSIAEFAGIGDFFDRPVKFYSSGMSARLAFAICVHVDADILIIDEVLAVGDEAFRRKCLTFLAEFRRRGTILLASHDLGTVNSLCDRAIWVDHGRLRATGEPAFVANSYRTALLNETDDADRFHIGD